jgi:hypothetical protein
LVRHKAISLPNGIAIAKIKRDQNFLIVTCRGAVFPEVSADD